MGSEPVDLVLKQCLAKLNHIDKFNEYIEYLHSEWLYTIEDMKLLSVDEHSWQSLKIPARLKIELTNCINELKTTEKSPSNDNSNNFSQQIEEPVEYVEENINSDAQLFNEWVLYYSTEHEAYYYYNTVTEESSWECPDESLHYEYQETEWTEEQQAEFNTEEVGNGSTEYYEDRYVNDKNMDDILSGSYTPNSTRSGPLTGRSQGSNFSPSRGKFSRPKSTDGKNSIFQDSPGLGDKQKPMPQNKPPKRRDIKDNIYANSSDSSSGDDEEDVEEVVIITPRTSISPREPGFKERKDKVESSSSTSIGSEQSFKSTQEYSNHSSLKYSNNSPKKSNEHAKAKKTAFSIDVDGEDDSGISPREAMLNARIEAINATFDRNNGSVRTLPENLSVKNSASKLNQHQHQQQFLSTRSSMAPLKVPQLTDDDKQAMFATTRGNQKIKNRSSATTTTTISSASSPNLLSFSPLTPNDLPSNMSTHSMSVSSGSGNYGSTKQQQQRASVNVNNAALDIRKTAHKNQSSTTSSPHTSNKNNIMPNSAYPHLDTIFRSTQNNNSSDKQKHNSYGTVSAAGAHLNTQHDLLNDDNNYDYSTYNDTLLYDEELIGRSTSLSSKSYGKHEKAEDNNNYSDKNNRHGNKHKIDLSRADADNEKWESLYKNNNIHTSYDTNSDNSKKSYGTMSSNSNNKHFVKSESLNIHTAPFNATLKTKPYPKNSYDASIEYSDYDSINSKNRSNSRYPAADTDYINNVKVGPPSAPPLQDTMHTAQSKQETRGQNDSFYHLPAADSYDEKESPLQHPQHHQHQRYLKHNNHLGGVDSGPNTNMSRMSGNTPHSGGSGGYRREFSDDDEQSVDYFENIRNSTVESRTNHRTRTDRITTNNTNTTGGRNNNRIITDETTTDTNTTQSTMNDVYLSELALGGGVDEGNESNNFDSWDQSQNEQFNNNNKKKKKTVGEKINKLLSKVNINLFSSRPEIVIGEPVTPYTPYTPNVEVPSVPSVTPIEQLRSLGFSDNESVFALAMCDQDVDAAAAMLLAEREDREHEEQTVERNIRHSGDNRNSSVVGGRGRNKYNV